MKNNKLLGKIIIGLIMLVLVGGLINERSRKSTQQQIETRQANQNLDKLVGNKAPVFMLSDLRGTTFTNESLQGKKVVLFFNEGLACYPACWDQMKQLSEDEKLQSDDVVAYSIVTDSKDSWRGAIEKKSDLAKIKVLFDENGNISKTFGALNVKSSMHAGTPGHTYVVLDKDGTVRWVLDDPRMGINDEKLNAQLEKIQ